MTAARGDRWAARRACLVGLAADKNEACVCRLCRWGDSRAGGFTACAEHSVVFVRASGLRPRVMWCRDAQLALLPARLVATPWPWAAGSLVSLGVTEGSDGGVGASLVFVFW